MKIPQDLHFYVGEKPPPTPCEYVDKDGDLITDIAGATLTALISIEEESPEREVSCTNNDDGTFLIDWNTTTSDITKAGWMRIRIKVVDGSELWYMDPEMIEVLD